MGVDVLGELLSVAQGVGPIAVLAFLVWKAQRAESTAGGDQIDATTEWRAIAEYYESQWRACNERCRELHGDGV